ncbi:MAG: cell division protein ZapA [Bacteroidales bacterium]|jgi:cell division protein ZapA|nr:cell division protein ZapA [Bacteroidales bacterium]
MDEKLSIKLNIDGHIYPIKVNRADEERYRKAGKLIDDRIKTYKQKFNVSSRTDFDFVAMAAIELVSKYLGNEEMADDTEMLSELRILSNDMNDYIQKMNAL